MERDEIISMALESCAPNQTFNSDEEWVERFAALVAEPWIETNKSLAKEIIELKKQAEQDAFAASGKPIEKQHIPPHVHIIKQIEIIPEQEPVGYFAYDEEHDIWEELTDPNAPGATKLYAAPVRTKDLTDDEIYTLYSEPCSDREMVEFARAVIAADREKNK